ncbi:MAG: NAD(P)-dependent oxidoreductase [Coriobacteriaceae bacterium]|nr:NAD(P)-dependent oxidoreductase [Coriobacteriaceae bacterium]
MISGATGLIGSALLQRCVDAGVEVLVLANQRSSRLNRLPDSSLVEVLPCALDDYATRADDPATAAMPRCDAFYHFAWDGTFGAARDDEELQARNVEHACDAVRLAAALGCRRFVGAGSQAEYGPLNAPYTAETPCDPQTGYGRGKLQAGESTRAAAHELGLEQVWTRIGSVYGPRDNPKTVLMQALQHALDGEPFACTAGEQDWDYLFSADAAEAFFLLGEHGDDGAVYPVGSGTTAKLRDYILTAVRCVDADFEPEFGALAYPPGQQMYLCADITALHEDTGFTPQVTFEDGIARTRDWYCKMRTSTSDLP